MISLVKGEKVELNLNRFCIGLGWDISNAATSAFDFDLDVSAFMLNSRKKLPSEEYFVFYNSENRVRLDDLTKLVKASAWPDNGTMREESRPVSPDFSVIGTVDDESGTTSEEGDNEIMDLDLDKVDKEIEEILVCVSIHDFAVRKQNFGQVERAYVRLYRPGEGEGEGEYIYDLSEDFSSCTAVEFCRFYRHNGGWKIQAVGNGYKGGLQELVDKYF